jgi:hypothetical protein
MKMLRGVLCLVGAVVLCACGPGDDSNYNNMELRNGGGAVPAASGRPSGGGWISNGLEDPNISGVDPSQALDAGGLAEDGELLANPELLGTAEYLVECALPVGQSISKTIDNQTVIFEGMLGLAPEWETDACDEDCQEWVSACLLARTNVSGEQVQIWMKGDHEALGWSAPAGVELEAAFYGNLFADPEDQYYCKGTKEGLVAAQREGRTCTSGSGCDFVKYSTCFTHERCNLDGPNQDVPTNCKAGGYAPYHTVASYVLP